MSFLGKNIRQFAEVTGGNLDEIYVNAAFNLVSSITFKSPVETGRYRGAWIATSSKPSTIVPLGVRRSSTVINEAVAKMQTAVTSGTTWYVTNNLPYARVIEYGLYPNPPKDPRRTKTINGFSKKARAGVARISVRKMIQDLNKDIIKRKIRGKI